MVVLLQVNGLIEIIVNTIAKIVFRTFLSCTKNPFEWQEVSCTKTVL